MAVAAPVVSPRGDAERVDQRVRLHAASWEDYERLLAIRGESAAPRISFLKGELELMSPSRDHELIKTWLARLLEAWAEELGVALEGAGSWTLKNRTKKLGAEPDECYFVGSLRKEAEAPDLAIEVVWTSGGLDKLEIYRQLGVGEVWFFQDGRLSFHVLESGRYRATARSARLPELDPDMLAACLNEPSQTASVKALRRLVRERQASRP